MNFLTSFANLLQISLGIVPEKSFSLVSNTSKAASLLYSTGIPPAILFWLTSNTWKLEQYAYSTGRCPVSASKEKVLSPTRKKGIESKTRVLNCSKEEKESRVSHHFIRSSWTSCNHVRAVQPWIHTYYWQGSKFLACMVPKLYLEVCHVTYCFPRVPFWGWHYQIIQME